MDGWMDEWMNEDTQNSTCVSHILWPNIENERRIRRRRGMAVIGNGARKNRAVDWIMLNGDSLTLTIRLDYRWVGRLGLSLFRAKCNCCCCEIEINGFRCMKCVTLNRFDKSTCMMYWMKRWPDILCTFAERDTLSQICPLAVNHQSLLWLCEVINVGGLLW